MFKELRLNEGLSRSDLSALTGRSVNYLLKAEDLTFPTPPIALVSFWLKRNPELERYMLEDAYYAAQKDRRRSWLDYWEPRPADTKHFSFCRKWLRAEGLSRPVGYEEEYTEVDRVSPTQYTVSHGLCVPASAVYFAEKYPHKPLASSIIAAVDDLVDYVKSGEYHAKRLYAVGTNEVMANLLRLRSELV